MSQRRLPQSRTVFVDAGGYFALLDEDDENHPRAVAIYQHLVAQRWYLITSSYIVAEAHALLLNRANHQVATRFLRDMQQSRNRVIWVTPADVERAYSIIYQHDDKDFSLTDATSFAVMERSVIQFAFAFDQHFGQYGRLIVLTPEYF